MVDVAERAELSQRYQAWSGDRAATSRDGQTDSRFHRFDDTRNNGPGSIRRRPEPVYDQTTALGQGLIGSTGTVTIKLPHAPSSRYLIAFVTGLSRTGANFVSSINEIAVLR